MITDESWNILYRSKVLDFTEEQWKRWADTHSGESIGPEGFAWEEAEIPGKKYFSIHSFPLDNEHRLIHHIYDVSGYADLFSDLSAYSKEWKIVAACQNALIENLSDDPCKCLDVAIRYFTVPHAILYLDNKGVLLRYVKRDGSRKIEVRKLEGPLIESTKGSVVNIPDMDNNPHICCCTGRTVSETGYALYVPGTGDTDKKYNSMLFNEFRLFIEDALLQRQIMFENEHDHLTGLYNKGKYLELFEKEFPYGESISVLNMDVNFLKRVNDTMGHEAGDILLNKAADSIKAVTDDRFYGFRMGGDEFLIVAMDISEEETKQLYEDWEKSLSEVNRRIPEPDCVIACGVYRKDAPYDLNEVMETADSIMYENKRRIKIASGMDPDSR